MYRQATNARPVEVLEGDGWVTFLTIKEAAEFIGVAPCTLSTSLIRDKPCKGFAVRYKETEQ